MISVIAVLGILLAITSLLLLVKPAASMQVARTYFVTPSFQYAAVVFSLLFSAACYYGAAETRFPQIFSGFAMFSAVGAVICLCLFPSQFRAIVKWEIDLFSPYPKALAFCYGLCSVFILYAVF